LSPAAQNCAAGFFYAAPNDPDRARLGQGENATRESQMSVLLVAFGALAAIWIVVLVGSPFFGPR